MNPLDHPLIDVLSRHPSRQMAYAGAWLLALVWWWIANRRSGLGPSSPTAAPPTSNGLDPYQIAYLAGGRKRAFEAAVLALSFRGLLLREGKYLAGSGARATSRSSAGVIDLPDCERELLACARVEAGCTLPELRISFFWYPELPLRQRGLLMDADSTRRTWLVSRMPMLFLVAVGLLSVPWVMLIWLALFPALLPRRLTTRQGQALLVGLRRQHRDLKTELQRGLRDATAEDLALAYALYGGRVLRRQLAYLRPVLRYENEDDD